MLRPRTYPFWFALGVLFCTGCQSLENSLVYHPAPAPETKLPPHPYLRDVELETSQGVKIHARWCKHPKATGAIIYCPGNAGNLDSRGQIINKLWKQLDESVLIFDYPGYGRSGGQPSEKGCYAAAEAAYNWLVQQKVAPANIIIYGESLGGGVAVDLASRKPHRALVLARTFTSVPDVAQAQVSWLPVSSVMYNRFNNLDKIGHCRRPIFIASADKDELIPQSHGRRLQLRCQAPNRLFILKGLGHNDAPGADYYEALREFLRNPPTVEDMERAHLRRMAE